MSIMTCDRHGRWDSDYFEECPRCLGIETGDKPLTKRSKRDRRAHSKAQARAKARRKGK